MEKKTAFWMAKNKQLKPRSLKIEEEKILYLKKQEDFDSFLNGFIRKSLTSTNSQKLIATM